MDNLKVKFISAAELVEEVLLANEDHKLGALKNHDLLKIHRMDVHLRRRKDDSSSA
jgi:hypothetical protein